MMKDVCLVFAMLLSIRAWAQVSHSKDLPLSNDSPMFIVGDDFTVAEGMMRADKLTESTELAFDTVTRIECYKHGGTLLAGSDAYCMQAAASVSFGMPSIDIEYLPVKSWGLDVIVAASSPSDLFPDCVWSEITFNLPDKSVMVTDIRKNGKGHEGLNNVCKEFPLSQTYHLVDTASEMARRSVRAARKNSSK